MSWAEAIGIIEEMRQNAVDQRSAPIVDCPFCGLLLDEKDGVWNCPLGHFRTTIPFREQTAVRG